ncbi:hypothetical protein DFQ28_008132 [Apophysomyces sp. BC1034]|nr:hypothetical protein DFQ30_008083 [Apophysomyces sp. BC1015]KAG0175580.1 hypothetical protein DFQ29_007119 [Apophysomyces sp. BC1021]KAG0186249.1 hypothetical protein DFQ28_008132 [Apophysomyces sp. BC1034]
MLSNSLWTLLLLGVALVAAKTGVDVASLTTVAQFQCAKNYGYSAAIVRCYFEAYGANPGGKIDGNCQANYNNAINAGLPVDLYMFPCTGRSTCKSPATQVQEIIDYVGARNMKVGRLWLDVEVDPASNNWPDHTSSRNTLVQFKNKLNGSGWKWGVYSSLYQWQTVTGDRNWVLDSSVPIWYSHYDEQLTFSDFSSFGGWTRPTIKQYVGDGKFCGTSFDKNFYG